MSLVQNVEIDLYCPICAARIVARIAAAEPDVGIMGDWVDEVFCPTDGCVANTVRPEGRPGYDLMETLCESSQLQDIFIWGPLQDEIMGAK